MQYGSVSCATLGVNTKNYKPACFPRVGMDDILDIFRFGSNRRNYCRRFQRLTKKKLIGGEKFMRESFGIRNMEVSGRIVIPKYIRDKLDIKVGDEVTIMNVPKKGEIIIKKVKK